MIFDAVRRRYRRHRRGACAASSPRPQANTTVTAAFPFANIERLRETGLAALDRAARIRRPRLRAAEAPNRVVNAIARGEASTGLVLAQQYLFHGSLLRNPEFLAPLREQIFRSRRQRTAPSSIRCASSPISARRSAADCRRRSRAAPRKAGGSTDARSMRPARRSWPGTRSGRAPTKSSRASAYSSSRRAHRACASRRPGRSSACGRAAATTSCSSMSTFLSSTAPT